MDANKKIKKDEPSSINNSSSSNLNNLETINCEWTQFWYKKKKKFKLICIILAPFTLFISLAFLPHLEKSNCNNYVILVYWGFHIYIVLDGKIIKKCFMRKKYIIDIDDKTNAVLTFSGSNGKPVIRFEENSIPSINIIEKDINPLTNRNNTKITISNSSSKHYQRSNKASIYGEIPSQLNDFKDDINNLYDGDWEQFEDDMENDIV